jgi:hypothetical protein
MAPGESRVTDSDSRNINTMPPRTKSRKRQKRTPTKGSADDRSPLKNLEKSEVAGSADLLQFLQSITPPSQYLIAPLLTILYNWVMKRLDQKIIDIASELKIPESMQSAFKSVIVNFGKSIPLPAKAPDYYDPARKEGVIPFLRRVWKDPWIDQGTLTRPDLRRLDQSCEMALRNWLRQHKKLPADLQIPTKSQALTRELRDEHRVREAQRLARASTMRNRPNPS